ncbi:ABC transporter permease [Chiayiivirga flava]|uniref:Putative ABC transport system permease protein n=1 Tax=Chiayiivirga flava TaxID=659595 RepID=A0A7W8D5E3_9GAMM|nr:FtsX-like permease family protein [Chiayiivirga flava]MBB5208228.1 putative ABC transport system permease protein [Chiayiivirga flava]
MTAWRLAWRFLRRDLASGEVRVLLAALVLAVTAVTAVGFITDRAERALALEANRLLGGDAVISADEPIGAAPRERASALGLAQTETLTFPSMLRAGDTLKLSDVRALGDGYPLRGSFRITDGADAPERTAPSGPARGTAWLTRSGAQAFGVVPGDTLRLGTAQFRLAALVMQEPDAAMDYFNVSPRVFIALDDVASTGLVQEGSRVTYRLVVAGDAAAAQQWTDATRDTLDRGQRLETIADARPEIRRSLERADRFLGLAALVSVVLTAIAVAMAARRHSARHLDACAVLRCLGASQRTILAIQLGELLLIGIAGCALGVIGGLALQSFVAGYLADVIGMDIPGAGPLPALQGFAVGFTVLLAFAAPPVLALRRVPALRVLRRDLGAVEPSAVAASLAGLAGLAALLWWKAGSVELGLTMLAGIAGTFVVLAGIAFGLVLLLRRVRTRLRGPWRYGLANVSRRAAVSVAQIAALGLGLMAILLLTLVRSDLLGRWQESMPADAPNRFIINVQPEQLDGAREVLVRNAVADPALYPMIRARLIEVNGEAVTGASYAERGDRARRLAEREFNLSSEATLREADNTLVEGAWWTPGDGGGARVSVEQSLAESLGWKLGDRVVWDIAGSRFEATIASLRRVDWESFRPNFFVVASPGALDGYAASYITAVRVPRGDTAMTQQLVQAFPNVSVIDVDAVIDQVRSTAEQVTVAVEYVFYFTLAAGLLVLLAAISASQDERLLEGGVMRVLGARTLQLRLAHASEFIAIGLIAGLVAAIAASVISGSIAVFVFEQPWAPDWRIALIGGGIGTLAVTVTGLVATRRVARMPPSQTLRALQG